MPVNLFLTSSFFNLIGNEKLQLFETRIGIVYSPELLGITLLGGIFIYFDGGLLAGCS